MENKLTTKEQEMKALKKIKAIVESLGENSYVATAFEGCFSIAEENIENDFACSMKQRYESEQKTAEKFRKEMNVLKQKSDSLEIQVGWLKKCLFSEKEIPLIKAVINERLSAQIQRRDKAGGEIIQYADDPKGDNFQQARYIHRDIIDDTVYAWDTKLPNMTVKRIYNTISPCEIKLKKYKSDGTTPLSGEKFELEFIKADQELTSAAKNYKPLLQEGEKITATTNAAGEVAFPNLDQGDYKITEVETVSGQTLLKDPINVHLPMEMTQEEADAYDNVDYSKGKFDEGYTNKWFFYGCTFEVTNSATFHIPTTGGGGVWKYGYMGMAVMATIGAGMIIYERKRRKK